MKLGADDDEEKFLATFKRVAGKEQWPTDSWSQALEPLPTWEAQRAYHTLAEDEVVNFTRLRKETLDHCGLSSTQAVSSMSGSIIPISGPATTCSQMLAPDRYPVVVIDQFLRSLPEDVR